MFDSQEQESLYSTLCSLGDFYALTPTINHLEFRQELAAVQDQWRPYNANKADYKREGLSLFSLDGSTDGEIDLNSLYEYNSTNGTCYNELSFRTPTENWKKLKSISEPLVKFVPHLGRSHLLRFDTGGFFPPHRDLGDTFRLISFLNCSPISLYMILDGKQVKFEANRLYFVNTRKNHTLFSFQKDATLLVLNVEISRDACTLVLRNLLEI